MLSMGLMTAQVEAILSDHAGQIQGQAPTGTGNLLTLYPDEKTMLTDMSMLKLNQIPNQFMVFSFIDGLAMQDTDGDAGLTGQIDPQSATLTWKQDGTPLTAAQLALPFEKGLAGKILTLEVSAPVTLSSVTGMPLTAGPQTFTSSYTLADTAIIESVKAIKNNALADGMDYVEMNIRVIDGYGNPIEGIDVAPGFSGNMLQAIMTATDANGIAIGRFTNKEPIQHSGYSFSVRIKKDDNYIFGPQTPAPTIIFKAVK